MPTHVMRLCVVLLCTCIYLPMHPRSVQDTPVPYSAGMLSYASYFRIPPHKKQHYVLNNCCYRGFQPLTSFAVRVHTHTMGRHVFMNRAPHTHKGAQHTPAAAAAPAPAAALVQHQQLH